MATLFLMIQFRKALAVRSREPVKHISIKGYKIPFAVGTMCCVLDLSILLLQVQTGVLVLFKNIYWRRV